MSTTFLTATAILVILAGCIAAMRARARQHQPDDVELTLIDQDGVSRRLCTNPSFVLQLAENGTSAKEHTFRLGHGVDGPGCEQPLRLVPECFNISCNQNACPWQQLARKPSIAEGVLVDRRPPFRLRELPKLLKEGRSKRAHANFAQAYGNVPVVYDLDPELTIGKILDRVFPPDVDLEPSLSNDVPLSDPHGVHPQSGLVSKQTGPCGNDAQHRADQAKAKGQLLEPTHNMTPFDCPAQNTCAGEGGAA